MPNRLTSVFLVALLASGCSFIQSWDDFRGEGDMDAGTDAGPGDASFDGGGEICDECEAEGCDSPSDECQFHFDGMCYHCNFDGIVAEGEFCGDDDRACAGALVCELGLCLYECGSRDDCLAASSLGEECVEGDAGTGRRVCIDHECDPVLGDCALGQLCFLGLPDDNLEQVGTICSYPMGLELGEGDACEFDSDAFCGNGLVCFATMGTGEQQCHRWCYPSDTACGPGEICVSIAFPAGSMLLYLGRDLGACVADIGTCDPTASPTGCSAGEVCVPDADGTYRCLPGGCTTDADCPSPAIGPPRCVASICVAECVDDAVCTVIGAVRCISHPSVPAPTMLCFNDCTPGETCPDGSLCTDLDGDGQLECLAPAPP